MSLLEVAVAVAIAVGIVGVVVPILPGTLLVAGAMLVWAWSTGGSTAWLVFALAIALLVVGGVVKYLVPGKRLKGSGVPNETLLVGALLGIIGFFVVPVIGIALGFALGVHLMEVRRVGSREARRTTVATLQAIGLSILIEFVAAVAAAIVWAVGVVAT